MPTPSATNVADLLAKAALFRGLSPALRSDIAQRMRETAFDAGQLVFSRSDPGTHLYLITEGKVRISVVTPDGKELSFRHVGPGEVLGEIAVLDGGARSADATAVAKTRAMSLSKPSLDELISHNPPLAKSALAFVCARLRETTSQLEAIALHPLEVRVARFLMQALRLKGLDLDQPEIVLTLGMSQGELALLVGASRPRVNDALAALEMAGAIKRDGAKLRCRPDELAALAGQDEE